MTVRRESMSTELSYSRYSNTHMRSGRSDQNLISSRIWPFVGSEVCPSEAERSGVKSKSNIKKTFIYLSVVI